MKLTLLVYIELPFYFFYKNSSKLNEISLVMLKYFNLHNRQFNKNIN